ncbi:leucine-rich repeat-containing protein 49-like [Macrobrachium nipponense]|uniref:leucine-rich repeat-containing protein 49-like n=1 Tax=Macrobrachium nipponense TaxID=159736 RepID=UPI0030C7CADA
MLRHVTGLRGLECLVELNLRRNLIRTVADLHYLPRLEKVFMGYNEIYRYEDIACLQNCLKLRELSLEENPISRQPNYFHHAVTKFYRLKRLDDQELTMDTRRQSEKQLQKFREKERAQATKISDEEKRNSAITNAMKHWEVIKKDHRKLVRKPSESSTSASDQVPSKESDAAENSSGFCGDTISDVGEEAEDDDDDEEEEEEEEGEEEELGVTITSDQGYILKDGESKQNRELQEDDRVSLISSATSSGISDVSLVQKNCERRLSSVEMHFAKENIPLNSTTRSIKQCTMNNAPGSETKANLPRSKSYTDMRVLRRKNSCDIDRPVRPKSVRGSGSHRSETDGTNGIVKGNEKISLDSRITLPIKNVPVVRRSGASGRLGSARAGSGDKAKPRIMVNNEIAKRSNSKNADLLKKTESFKNSSHLPDKVVTAAITRVRSNLSLPTQGPETPISPRSAISEPSELDSSSDAESTATATTTNTAVTATSNPDVSNLPTNRSSQHNLADLKVPLTRPKDPERSIVERGDKSVQAINPNTSGILREQGPNFLAELEGDRLSLYGQGALRCTDISWEKSMAAAAATARFQYMNFEDIIDIFPKLRVKFPRLENFIFVETHLAKCSQLNALAELHQVTALDVGEEGNPLTQVPHWRLYAIFRLSHWGLRIINGREVTEDERTDAALMFSPLSQLAFTCLPKDQLAAFLSSHNHNNPDNSPQPPGHHANESGVACKDDLDGPRLNVPHLQDLIGKEALQYRPTVRLTQEESSALIAAGRQARQLVVWAYSSLERLHTHHATWPSVLHDLVRDAVTDLTKPTYGKQCLEDIKRNLGWKK